MPPRPARTMQILSVIKLDAAEWPLAAAGLRHETLMRESSVMKHSTHAQTRGRRWRDSSFPGSGLRDQFSRFPSLPTAILTGVLKLFTPKSLRFQNTELSRISSPRAAALFLARNRSNPLFVRLARLAVRIGTNDFIY